MKLILSTTMVLMLTTASASAFSFPAHEPDGYRDTGCDEAANVEIKNAEGKVLYLNNPTCPPVKDGPQPAKSDEPKEDPDDSTDPGDGDASGDDEK